MAMYNNGFPATYQPIYPYAPVQMPQQGTQAQTTAQSGINWIQGEAAAKAYLVAPNSTVQLWDSQEQVIYLKSADASGMPSMKVLDYTIRESGNNAPSKAIAVSGDKVEDYATKEEMRAISDQITALRKKVERLTKKHEDEEDE